MEVRVECRYGTIKRLGTTALEHRADRAQQCFIILSNNLNILLLMVGFYSILYYSSWLQGLGQRNIVSMATAPSLPGFM
jgi:hypothetical protein